MLEVDYNHISAAEAMEMQAQLKAQIRLEPLDRPVTTIAGADISFNKFSTTVYAGIVVLSFPELKVIEEATAITEVTFPYVPGLLGFREIPAIAEAWNKLSKKPDVLIADGHGIAHPRKMGIATHFGLLADTPTIGCAKSLLCGRFEEPDSQAGATEDLWYKKEVVGKVLRSKTNCKPVFVSPGHRITMEESLAIIQNCKGKYRIPEPTRLAHLLVNKIRIASISSNGDQAGTPPGR